MSKIKTYFIFSIYSFGVFILQSCYHAHQDKFGTDKNGMRLKLKLPIIKDGWTLKDEFDSKAPQHYSIWYTDVKPAGKSLPYHAYKTIYYSHDTLIAESDTYLNMQLKWYDNDNQVISQSDQLKNTYAMYHSLSIIYLYYPIKINTKDFTTYKKGFNYEIQGVKNGFSDIQLLDSLQAEGILSGWNLKRLNY